MKQVIIDVREPDEYEAGHVEGSLNIPPNQLLQGAPQLNGLAKNTRIIVYCRTGSRSNVAMHILNGLGFNNVTNGINKQGVEAMLPQP